MADEMVAAAGDAPLFGDEFMALQGIKRAIIEKANKAGIGGISGCILVVNRLDSHLENTILYLRHAEETISFFKKLAADAVAGAAAPKAGENVLVFDPNAGKV